MRWRIAENVWCISVKCIVMPKLCNDHRVNLSYFEFVFHVWTHPHCHCRWDSFGSSHLKTGAFHRAMFFVQSQCINLVCSMLWGDVFRSYFYHILIDCTLLQVHRPLHRCRNPFHRWLPRHRCLMTWTRTAWIATNHRHRVAPWNLPPCHHPSDHPRVSLTFNEKHLPTIMLQRWKVFMIWCGFVYGWFLI